MPETLTLDPASSALFVMDFRVGILGSWADADQEPLGSPAP
jgi:hypothetical protein